MSESTDRVQYPFSGVEAPTEKAARKSINYLKDLLESTTEDPAELVSVLSSPEGLVNLRLVALESAVHTERLRYLESMRKELCDPKYWTRATWSEDNKAAMGEYWKNLFDGKDRVSYNFEGAQRKIAEQIGEKIFEEIRTFMSNDATSVSDIVAEVVLPTFINSVGESEGDESHILPREQDLLGKTYHRYHLRQSAASRVLSSLSGALTNYGNEVPVEMIEGINVALGFERDVNAESRRLTQTSAGHTSETEQSYNQIQWQMTSDIRTQCPRPPTPSKSPQSITTRLAKTAKGSSFFQALDEKYSLSQSWPDYQWTEAECSTGRKTGGRGKRQQDPEEPEEVTMRWGSGRRRPEGRPHEPEEQKEEANSMWF